jgi:dipeptidyl aminopeptidase/acylaminoacyl peptidase
VLLLAIAQPVFCVPFRLDAEIDLVRFGNRYDGQEEKLAWSPDGELIALYTEQGRVSSNRVEDSLIFYRRKDIEQDFTSNRRREAQPFWVIRKDDAVGGVFQSWRWLQDSSGVAFVQRMPDRTRQLFLADIAHRSLQVLSSPGDSVRGFDIQDRRTYVYTVRATGAEPAALPDAPGAAIVVNGRHLSELLLPDDAKLVPRLSRRAVLHAVVNGKRVTLTRSGRELSVFSDQLALSPNGHFLITDEPVPEIPLAWERLYPPPFAGSGYRVRAGPQDPAVPGTINRYVLIDLLTGTTRPLTRAPMADTAGWFSSGTPSWSRDGFYALLPNTFLAQTSDTPSSPCVTRVKMSSMAAECIEIFAKRSATEPDAAYRSVENATFVQGDGEHVKVVYRHQRGSPVHSTNYIRQPDGHWETRHLLREDASEKHSDLKVFIEESIDAPPLVVARYRGQSSVIWDPNPELAHIQLTPAHIYTWNDPKGRLWRGILFEPENFGKGTRSPLVLQTHGFVETEFEPSGMYPTAFAARALTAAGFAVLQVSEDSCPSSTAAEAQCAVEGYESAVEALSAEGQIDPKNIGIIGFSRTCLYVMRALTGSSLTFRAAAITDGLMNSYVDYMLAVSGDKGGYLSDANGTIGGAPIGAGLKLWIAQSPTFNLDKVSVPLSITVLGRSSLLSMWEAYAGLSLQDKPVELMMINSTEHVLTNPAARQASQGGTVDWFRFWMKGEENLDTGKTEQYVRWRALRTKQENALRVPASTAPNLTKTSQR